MGRKAGFTHRTCAIKKGRRRGPESDNTIGFEIAQETPPATFIKGRNVGHDKMADALLSFRHQANINRLIPRQGVSRHTARCLDNGIDIPDRFNTDQEV